MSTSQLSRLARAARFCAAFAAAAALWAAIAPECQAQVPPPNDGISQAQALVGVSGTVYGTNLFATAQTNEPAPFSGSPAGASIWYLWTAPISTTIDFKTRGSTTTNGLPLPTAMAVYRLKVGTNVAFNNLVLVAQNENDPSGGPTSRVDFAATLGTLYLIQVDGASSGGAANAQGYISLTWSPSLVAGTFQFTTSIFPLGAADDGFIIQPAGTLAPSVHNAQGGPNGRITITRTGGYTGRCEMQLVVTNSFYTNLTITNITGTNIFMTNYVGGVPTRLHQHPFHQHLGRAADCERQFGLHQPYFNVFFGTLLGETNANGSITIGEAFEAITNLPTGPCLDQMGQVTFQTNVVGTVTNVLATRTDSFLLHNYQHTGGSISY